MTIRVHSVAVPVSVGTGLLAVAVPGVPDLDGLPAAELGTHGNAGPANQKAGGGTAGFRRVRERCLHAYPQNRSDHIPHHVRHALLSFRCVQLAFILCMKFYFFYEK